jgi:hypothetical protein
MQFWNNKTEAPEKGLPEIWLKTNDIYEAVYTSGQNKSKIFT